MPSPKPHRGDFWTVDLDPTIGHEQAGTRPALVISEDTLNQSLAEIVILLPVTSRNKGIRSHVQVPAGEGGLTLTSFIKCEDVRSVSTRRPKKRIGSASQGVLRKVEERLRLLMRL